MAAPRSGRRAQAARNDQLILDAARAVFVANPEAPIASVAERAGVGISALYRRYRSKDELLQRLAADSLSRYIAEAEAAVADQGNGWATFASFMQRCLDGGAMSVTLRLAGRFPPTDELQREGYRAATLTQQLLDRTKTAAALRPEIEVGDIMLLFEQLQSIKVGDEQRTRGLRQRYLGLVLDGLRTATAESLPGPPPSWPEMNRRYAGGV